MQTSSQPARAHPFVDGIVPRRLIRYHEASASYLRWALPTFSSAFLPALNSQAPRAHWPWAGPLLEVAAGLAASAASDPRAHRVEQIGLRIEARLAAGERPEMELRELAGFLLSEADPALAREYEVHLAALDNGARLHLRIDPLDPRDAFAFRQATYALSLAFEHGNGALARSAMGQLCSFIVEGEAP